MDDSERSKRTDILKRSRAGDRVATAELFPLVYDELRRLASSYMRRERAGHTLQATALVHETFLQLISGAGADWKDRAHLLGVAANAMRQILILHARRARAQKRGGGRIRVTLGGLADDRGARELDLLDVDELLRRLEALDERKARVVELRFFGGLTHNEIAELLSVSPKTVEADWYMARAWLRGELRKGQE
jgi:RNA polymerase sigma factor (TIGR02999 family)